MKTIYIKNDKKPAPLKICSEMASKHNLITQSVSLHFPYFSVPIFSCKVLLIPLTVRFAAA
jgi:hypothetical protein